MKPENAIEVKDVTKKFKVYLDKGHTLKEKFLFKNSSRYEERKVLKGISFEVKKGEGIGLIGHNGCGKSTTLKLLTRIMYPDTGTIEMRGRVSSLIELGAGFHPDMSGRQNIYTNASIFGLTRKEIDARIHDIIEFSELREFIDNPVRTYSSGMYTRLAFSVAINVDADILLIDEILAVGDANFQAKCFERLKKIKASGTTIVIVSHSLGQIEEICEKSIWIHEGLIKAEGIPREIHPQYLAYMGQKRLVGGSSMEKADNEEKREDSICTCRMKMYNKKGKEQHSFKTGEGAVFTIDYKTTQPLEDVILNVAIFRVDGVRCYATSTKTDHKDYLKLDGEGQFQFEVEALTLLPGSYSVDFSVCQDNDLIISYLPRGVEFVMYSDMRDVGVSRIEHEWRLSEE